jgi:Amt family ammonium transporter
LIATGLIGPAVAERSRFVVPIVAGLLLAVVVIPISARWVWFGWLHRLGFIDVAGAVPIHLSGAMCALAAVLCAGPRTGKYNRDGSTNGIPGHHVPLISIGAALMLVGWLPYVMAASLLHASIGGMAEAARAALNALIAAAAGGFAAAAVAHIRSHRNDLTVTCAGMLCGAVALTAAGGSVGLWASAVLGALAGWLAPIVLLELDLYLRVDDPGGGIAVHGVGALVGTIGVAVVSTGSVSMKVHQLGVQVLGLIVVGGFGFVCSFVLLAVLKSVLGMRVRDGDEFDGLDLAEHDINAYPDFQQTTIKSYHLREA